MPRKSHNIVLNCLKNHSMQKRLKKFFYVVMLFQLGFCGNGYANHIYGAEIYYTHDTGDVYIVTVQAYIDCGSSTTTQVTNAISATTSEGCAAQVITYSVGNPCCVKDITPRASGICDLCSDPKCSYGFGISRITMTAKFGLPSGCCNYIFSWSNCCYKSATTTSLQNIYVECLVNRCVSHQNSPVYQFEPATIICVNQPFDRSETVYAGNSDDSVYYHFADPLSGPGSPSSYNSPYTSSTPLIYSGTDPDAIYKLPLCLGMHYNPATGRMNFKATKTDITIMALEADEYRRDSNGKYVLAGSTSRCCILNIINCSNNHIPIISGINGGTADTFITCSNNPVNIQVKAFDIDQSDTVSFSALNESPGTLSFSGAKWPVATFKWTPENKDVRNTPYCFTLTAQDNFSPMPGTTQKRIFIFVRDSFPLKSDIQIADSGCGKYHFSVIPSAKGYLLNYNWLIDSSHVSALPEFTFKTTVAGKHRVSLILSDNGGCSKIMSGYFNYDLAYQLHQHFVTTCKNIPVALYSSNIISPKWTPVKGLNNPLSPNPFASPDATTTYYVTGKDQGGCIVSDSVRVFVKDFTETIKGNPIVCPGSSTTLVVTGGNKYYWWPSATLSSNADASVIASPTQETWYYVNIGDTATGCSKIDSIKISLAPAASRYPDLLVCNGSGVQLKAGAGSSFHWSPSADLSNPKADNTMAFPVASTLYTVIITDQASNCFRTDTQMVIVDKDCVWPGDADHNRTSDYLDVLQIGVAYSAKGPARPYKGITWHELPCLPWLKSNGSGINYKHMDCNGDGIVDANDTAAITLNYGKKHKKWTPGSGNPADPPIYFKFVKDTFYAGETAIAYLYAGTTAKPLNNSYGIGYQCGSSGSPVIAVTDQITPLCDFFCTANQLNYVHPGSVGSFDVATVQTNGSANQNSQGRIAVLKFQLPDEKVHQYSTTGDKIFARLYSATVINHTGQEINIFGMDDSAIVLPNPSGVKPGPVDQGLIIYPNPANAEFTIESTNTPIQKVVIFNSFGQRVRTILPASEKLSVDVSTLLGGIYYISINDGIFSRDWKIVVQR
jgi:hypothetical protein